MNVLRSVILAAGLAGLSLLGCDSTTAPVDKVAPWPVQDLAVCTTTETSVTLIWTPTGDNRATGRASSYDLRYSTEELTTDNWGAATRVSGLPAPIEVTSLWTRQLFTVSGLTASTRYYFGLKAADEVDNRSPLSNVTTDSTASIKPLYRKTFDLSLDSAPTWSPDGTQLAFQTRRTGSWDIALIGLDCSVDGPAVPLVLHDRHVEWPAWSPDGSLLAFTASEDGEGDIMIVPAAGGQTQPIATGLGTVGHPCWSPDGTQIAFAADSGQGGDIWIVPATGGEATRLTTHPAVDWYPTWSPDGTTIAFHSDRDGNWDIFAVPVGGGVTVKVTDGNGDNISPRFSPDGSHLAFCTNRDGNWDVWLIAAGGGNPEALTIDPGQDLYPCWSPDGLFVAFASNRLDGNTDVYTVPVD